MRLGSFPFPATQGGAIETLMTSIVNQNELYKELDLTVVTTFDDESKRLAKSLHYTKFVLIPSTTVFERLKHRVKNVSFEDSSPLKGFTICVL